MAALVGDYEAGLSSTELRGKYGLSKGSVLRLLRKSGVVMRRRSLGDGDVAEMVERYQAGLTIRNIAAERGLAKTTVQDALARAEV